MVLLYAFLTDTLKLKVYNIHYFIYVPCHTLVVSEIGYIDDNDNT